MQNFRFYSLQGQNFKIFLIFTYNQGKVFLIFTYYPGGTCIPGLHWELLPPPSSRSGDAKHTKTTLSIEQKLKVLDYAKENPKESCRTLSTKFSVGKTTDCCYFKKTRLNYLSRALHIVEITVEITNVLLKVDIRRSTKLCTNGIH